MCARVRALWERGDIEVAVAVLTSLCTCDEGGESEGGEGDDERGGERRRRGREMDHIIPHLMLLADLHK